ncbi:hypothetical protein FRC07_003119 [Ceratobasidium sp. 392]|nr:hypothetical protein FRC07_003119 [Ceratobasidium sp. 392]
MTISDEHLSRFSKYARFIKHLELTVFEDSCIRSVKNSGALLAYAQTNTVLPNIRTFILESYYDSRSKLDWAVALFSSSLIEIRCKSVPGGHPPLPLQTALLWLESIASKCPNVQTLELHPYSPWVDWDENAPLEARETNALIRTRFRAPLARLTQLRNLHINAYLTGREDVSTLSRLPQLERLEICSGQQLDAMVIMPNFLPESFSALRYLALRNLQLGDLENIYRAPLLESLNSFYLVVGPQPDPEEGPARYGRLLNWFPIWEAEAKFRQLSSLTLIFEILDYGETVVLYEDELHSLAALPLRYIFVRGATAQDDSGSLTSSELLASLWPAIAEIHFPDQPATTEDLIHFAGLINLRHLTLNLVITAAPMDVSLPMNRSSEFRVLQCSTPEHFNITEKGQTELAK